MAGSESACIQYIIDYGQNFVRQIQFRDGSHSHRTSSNRNNSRQNESVREKLCPILADIFLAETEDFTELILANFEFSLDNTERDHLCQLQNNKQKLSFMFNHSIIKFQKDMKDLGFTKALTQNEEFYIMTNLHYKKISPTKALEVIDLCQGSL